MADKLKFHDYSKDLAGAILSVRKDGEKLKVKIHNVALSIITAWGKKQVDKDAAAKLFTELGDAAGYHGKALANWIAMKTPLKYSEENECWYAEPDASVNGDTFKAARDEPFWEITPPSKPQPFDGKALLMALLTKNASKAAKPKEGDNPLPSSLVNRIRQAIAEYDQENIDH